jgi:phospholipid/cholesterol/gamma-HCH transport system permease protein
MGVIVRLVRKMNDALGITSILVSHDVQEIASVADCTHHFQRQGGASGSPSELQNTQSKLVQQFAHGMADGLRRFTSKCLITKSNCLAGMPSNGPCFATFTLLSGIPAHLRRHAVVFPEAASALPNILTKRFNLVVHQVYNAGALSLVIIMVCGLFVGGVLGLQGHSNLSKFNAEDSVGTFAAFSLIKELGPVITALLFAGRAGTALASEIGLMKATDQLSAMEMMAIDPLRRVLVPRFLGGVIAMPLLVAVFTVIGLFGAHLVGVTLLGVDAGAFWQQMQSTLEMGDIYEGIVKSFVFGVVASLYAVWEGYNAVPTAEGVGRATTRTVVLTAIAVLILDFMITAVSI